MKYDPYSDNLKLKVFDIETMGLYPAHDMIINAGFCSPDGSGLFQNFAKDPSDERRIIEEILEQLEDADGIITYNGNRFDLPFVLTRAKKYGLCSSLPMFRSIDIYRLLNGSKAVGWMEADKARWEEWRELVLKYPTATEEEYSNIPFINAYYISNGGKPIDRYLFSVNERYYSHQHVWFDDRDGFIKQPAKFGPFRDYQKNEYIIMTMSEENANLQTILKYPGLRQWWLKKGYAEHFKPNPYIVSPILYTEILKGAYGEMAGRFIIWKELQLLLESIEDPHKYEVADFKIKDRDNEYVDFKYYTPATSKDYDEQIKNMSKKCDKLEAERLYVINIVKGGSKEMYEPIERCADQRIVIIPWLIDKDGSANPEIKQAFL